MAGEEVSAVSPSHGDSSDGRMAPQAQDRAGSSSEAAAEGDKPWHSYDTVFLNAKAGMSGVDKEKVQKVVYEMSKGSRYFENEQRKEAILQQRIEKFREQAAKISTTKLAETKAAVDRGILELEASRNLDKTWMHVDMDAFYAAVETVEDVSLSCKPMAVGGMSMICTANYEARKFGVRAAMPGFIACKLCPDLVLIKPNFEKYTHYSELTRQVFRLYDKNFIARSLDEAYLDITEFCRTESIAPAEVAERLRKDVFEKTKLTCSAGVAANRLLAKVCSDINKPNGQFVLESDREKIMEFVSKLPIRKVSGIGKVTERLLKDVLSINMCSDLIENRYLISALFSTISTDFFLSVGLGIGASEAPHEEQRKSISNERTFSPTSDANILGKILGDLAESLSEDMIKENLQGRTLTLKLKTSTFEVRSRAVSVQHFISSKKEIESLAIKLLKAELPISLRLLGVRVSQFKEDDPSQKSIASFLKDISDAAVKDDDLEHDYDEQTPYLSDTDRDTSCKHTADQWTQDDRCSLCGERISSEYPTLRQEHEDFHFALKIQQQDSVNQLEVSKRSIGKRPITQSSDRGTKKSAKNRNSIESYFAKN
ncbi:DNA polymerase kappa [Selaginella moellendorffii]|uniref:DNA polymerase kappa n=1 Tax=Selaginella moellendorffii TaxID=88036 RepID=UPI000D1C7D1F|nr:DNA polymerase kappa [Selaginella moellendorffii]|eukprot:XP_024531805.1 DNA polymerase kappa [Selaginella moellendorffii]